MSHPSISVSLRVVSAGTTLLVGLGLVNPQAAAALCLSGTLNSGNNCTTFNNSGSTTATLLFSDAGLNSNRYLQIGFSSQGLGSVPPPTLSSGFLVSNIEYSLDNTTFTPFRTVGTGTGPVNQAISNNGESSFTALYTAAVDLGTPLNSINTTLYIRYNLPTTISSDGQTIRAYLRYNADGAIQPSPSADANGTQLLSTADGSLLTRNHRLNLATPDAAPGPLPLLGAAAAFGASRRLRRRCGYGHRASAKLEG